jgi:hypothetical protein
MLDATAAVPDGHDLATFLATRHRYINLSDVDWVGTGERVPHMALKVSTVLWASTGDGALPLTPAAAAEVVRRVEVELEGGYLIAAELQVEEGQHLTDYLHEASAFVPLRDAELRPRQKPLGDVVVNQASVQVVREVPVDEDTARSGPAEGPGEGGDDLAAGTG